MAVPLSMEWLSHNFDRISRVDALISARLADGKDYHEYTDPSLCDDVFTVLTRGLSSGENSSILLLGEAGSGKTHIVEWCLKKLCDVQPSLIVLRAYGSKYASDVECIRHLAAQAAGQTTTAPRSNMSFELGMEWIRGVLTDSFQVATAVVVVLDKLEYFCSKARQTLLYNLFDIAQEAGVQLSIVATSEKMDVMGSLEKRIQSRFSMRHLHTFLPTTMYGLLAVLAAKLRLQPSGSLKAPFLKQFHRSIEVSLRTKAQHWQASLELGRPPSWFLNQCLPVSALLLAGCRSQAINENRPPAKRQRTTGFLGSLPSTTSCETRALMLQGLSEVQHILLIALCRMDGRRATKTLASVLHEVERLHKGHHALTASWNPDHYCVAFHQLIEMRLVEFCCASRGDLPKRYWPCRSAVDHAYAEFARNMDATEASMEEANPLRRLPQPVQQWAGARESKPTPGQS